MLHCHTLMALQLFSRGSAGTPKTPFLITTCLNQWQFLSDEEIICESPTLLDSKLWGKMLDSIVTLLSRTEEERVQDEPEVPDFGETVGYNPTFVYLYNARKKEQDPLKEIMDPKQFLVTS
ncbi:transporter [Lithospermum erythrorhizon]|uniref:Transporter n=1 Tax=Lithospermum erythrorhizon TaxID=34254 RepID=A0AAV3S1K3_LITER